MDKRGNIKGQMNLSFGMIFTIIMIIVFLAFAFYAIKKFIDLQQSVQIDTFLNNFQDDINKMWKSVQGSQTVVYPLPSYISAVCFINGDPVGNLKFTSSQIVPEKTIENIDQAKITQDENPYCIQTANGKLSMTIEKNFGETLVTVTR